MSIPASDDNNFPGVLLAGTSGYAYKPVPGVITNLDGQIKKHSITTSPGIGTKQSAFRSY
jgi:hypothetical protein